MSLSKELVDNINATGDYADKTATDSNVVKDGNYFLQVLKYEQTRLLALADVADKYIKVLNNKPNVSEDTFGLLRSASGKARLLVTQKMRQFEGLCQKNLELSPETEAYPTTNDDLQGFWDMVYLQVMHIDSIFVDIENLKANNWKPQNKSSTSAKHEFLRKTTTTLADVAARSKSKTLSNAEASIKREAERKKLSEWKRQRRESLAAAKNSTS